MWDVTVLSFYPFWILITFALQRVWVLSFLGEKERSAAWIELGGLLFTGIVPFHTPHGRHTAYCSGLETPGTSRDHFWSWNGKIYGYSADFHFARGSLLGVARSWLRFGEFGSRDRVICFWNSRRDLAIRLKKPQLLFSFGTVSYEFEILMFDSGRSRSAAKADRKP